MHVPFPPWPGTQQQLGLPWLPQPGQAKAGVNPEFRMKKGPGEGTAPWETPRPPSPSTIRRLQPPPRWSVWTNVSKQPQMVPSLPRPPSTASAPSLGAEQQGFGKGKCVSPPNVSRSIHTTAHGVSHVGSCSALGVARSTGGCGVSVCQFQNLRLPPPQERAGPWRWREDAMEGGSHGGGMPWWGIPRWQSRSTPAPCPSPPGPAPSPCPGLPGAAARPRGVSGCKTKRPIKPCPYLQLFWKHPAPRHGSTRDEAALLPLPALPPPFMGPFGLGRPCPCVPQPLGVSDLLSAGPDGACIARKSAS